MRVLLISPPFWGEKKHKHAPLGLFYIANYIKTIAEVKVIDCNVSGENIESVTRDFNPEIIGISVLTPTVNQSIIILKQLKCINPTALYVAGGIHASSFPEDMLNAGFDLVIRGEGELTFYDLVSNYQSGEMYSIDGISFYDKTRDTIIERKNRERIYDLDAIGFPKLSKDQIRLYEYASIIASRGCYYQCYYCSSSYYWKRVVRVRSANSVLDEIRYYISIGIKSIYFCDDNFFCNRDMVVELCNKIINNNLKIKWNALVRIDSIDDEMIALMKKAGCVCLSIGIECGIPEVLRQEKGIDIENLIENVRLIQKYGIFTRTTWIIGMGKSYEDELQSLDLMKKLMPNQISIHLLIPYPNTDAWRTPDKYNLIIDKAHINYDVFSTTYSPELMKVIKFKHMSEHQVKALVIHIKREMCKLGYSDINDNIVNKYKVIESFLDDAIVPMII